MTSFDVHDVIDDTATSLTIGFPHKYAELQHDW